MTRAQRVVMNLRECASGRSCKRCSYYCATLTGDCKVGACVNNLMSEAADVIEALEAGKRARRREPAGVTLDSVIVMK